MLTLVFALMLQGQEPVSSPQPPLYRWKDRTTGQIRVTSTLPPHNAIILEPASRLSVTEVELAPMVIPTKPEELRARMESVLKEETITYWHRLEKTLQSSRQTEKNAVVREVMDGALTEALFGDGLWALLLVPLFIMAIFLLLAAWVGRGLPRRRAKAVIWVSFTLAGFILSHFGLQRSLYRLQAKRLEFMLAMLPNYLGGHTRLKSENQRIIQTHAESLQKATSPLSLAWSFPIEVIKVRHTLINVIEEP